MPIVIQTTVANQPDDELRAWYDKLLSLEIPPDAEDGRDVIKPPLATVSTATPATYSGREVVGKQSYATKRQASQSSHHNRHRISVLAVEDSRINRAVTAPTATGNTEITTARSVHLASQVERIPPSRRQSSYPPMIASTARRTITPETMLEEVSCNEEDEQPEKHVKSLPRSVGRPGLSSTATTASISQKGVLSRPEISSKIINTTPTSIYDHDDTILGSRRQQPSSSKVTPLRITSSVKPRDSKVRTVITLSTTDEDSASSFDDAKQRRRAHMSSLNDSHEENRQRTVKTKSASSKAAISRPGHEDSSPDDDDDGNESDRDRRRDKPRRRDEFPAHRRRKQDDSSDREQPHKSNRDHKGRDKHHHRKRREDDNDSDITSPEGDTSPERNQYQQNYRERRKEVKVDNFAGDSSIEAYIAQFQLAAERNGWPRHQWGIELALRLRGEARNVILPEIGKAPPTYQKAVKLLRERFGEPKHPAYHVAQIRARRRKEKESLPELAQWFKKMGLQTYPSERADTRDRILLDSFVRSLPDESQRCYVWDKEPDGLEGALAAALRYEGIRHTEN